MANSSHQHATVSWNFGDGGISTVLSPSHTYSANGIYIATLTVTNYSPACVLSYSTYVNVSTITSISQLDQESDFNVLPNPSSVLLQITGNVSKNESEFVLIDILGKETIKTKLLGATTTVVDISQLENGVYYYQVTSKGQKIKTGQVVLKK